MTFIPDISIPIAILGLAALAAGLRLRNHIPTETYRLWMRRLLVLLAAILMGQTCLNL